VDIAPDVAHDPRAPSFAIDRLADFSGASPGSALSFGRFHPGQPTAAARPPRPEAHGLVGQIYLAVPNRLASNLAFVAGRAGLRSSGPRFARYAAFARSWLATSAAGRELNDFPEQDHRQHFIRLGPQRGRHAST
jgi:hypothetical protein